MHKYTVKKAIHVESLIFVIAFTAFFGAVGAKMGMINMINTLIASSYDLLMSTVFYIMAVAVLAGALSEILMEFGVVAVLNRVLSPVIKPVFGLPGASIVGIFATYFSDNPAILVLASNKSFAANFKKYQLLAVCNLGTAFGMGLIVSTFLLGLSSPGGGGFVPAVIIGNISSLIGAIISVRVMLYHTKKHFGTYEDSVTPEEGSEDIDILKYRAIRPGSGMARFLSALLDGGQSGVSMSLKIIPGVLIICSFVLILTNGPSISGVYTGGAYEGVAFFPWIGEKLSFILNPLFGFSSSENLAVPITALGSAGAAMGIIPGLVSGGYANGNDVAVFAAMCMSWSGYLSTHLAMMEALGYRSFAGKAILAHTIGGVVAGVSANWIFKLLSLLSIV